MHNVWHIGISVGLGISIPLILVLVFKILEERARLFMLKSKIRHDQTINSMKNSTIDRWIAMTEKNIKQTGLKINVRIYIVFSIVSAFIAFILGMHYFKNLTAAILLSACFFVLPEHVISIVNQKRKEKIKEQMITAIRVFTAEFLQTPGLERGFEAIGKRISDPLGRLFRRAHMELVLGTDSDVVLARLAGQIDNEYGRMFIQLLKLAKSDSSVSSLFADLLERIENNIELTRKNHSNLTGERILALIMTCIPMPAYFLMMRLIPETSYFLAETLVGRLVITITFGSMLVWTVLDRIAGKVEE